jgi:putative ABC transport system permease protein
MMIASGSVKTAIASLRGSRWRSLLTMLGIIIGVTSVVTIVSLGEGLKQQIASQINQLGSDVVTVRSGKLVNRGESGNIDGVNLLAFLSTSTLTNEDVSSLDKLNSADAVVPIDFVTSSAKADSASSDNLFVVGTNYKMADVLHRKLEFGAFFDQEDSDKNVAVIGSNVAHQLFGEHNPIGRTISVAGSDFIIHGVLEQTSGGLISVAETDFNSAVFIPIQSALDLTENKTNILQILIKSKSSNLDQTITDTKKVLLKNHKNQEDFTVLKQTELLNIAGGTVGVVTRFISAIAAVSLLVGGISIMDIMWVSVSERTREIGIRKAIGATNRQILNQFLVEGSLLSIFGGLIGIVASLIINGLLRLYTSLHPAITIPIMILAVGISVGVGILFSVAPALKAARKRPMDALRGE